MLSSLELHPATYVCLAGPTASGKSAAALALAQALPIEIISVDSALVYRGMDIGTAKPSALERAAVPHHLIDLIEPTQHYSAAQFVIDARAHIAHIHARKRLPVLVGGTMLYFKALLHGLDELPSTDLSVRAHINEQARQLGWPALHQQLSAIDPLTARRLAPHDAQRIQRALEVWHSSGRALSSFHTGRLTEHTSRDAHCLAFIALEPTDRLTLHERIAQRFDAMLEAGFLDEVRRLRQRGDLHLQLPSMRCVGYRQAWECWDEFNLDGQPTPPAEAFNFSPAHLRVWRERAIAATRQLAKRQLTWLRGIERHRIDCDRSEAVPDQVIREVTRIVSSPCIKPGHPFNPPNSQ